MAASTPGKTVSFNNTPQAKDDSFGGVKENSTGLFTFDVMVNDAGGSGKSLYSVGYASGNDQSALLTKDSAGLSFNTATDATKLGAKIWITADGKVAYQLTDAVRNTLKSLAAGVTTTDSFTYAIQMGNNGALSWATANVTITGTDDAAVIVANTTTPIAPVTDSQLQTSGKLNISDVDNALAAFAAQAATPGTNGTFTLSADGTWTYTADAAKVAALADKATVTDSFTAVSADGTASTVVTVTITGKDDAAVIVANTTTPIAPVTDSQLQTSGKLNISDVDNALAAFAAQAATPGTNGTFTLSADGTWTYTADAAKVAALADKATVTDSFTAVSADGTASTVVTVTITGKDDAAVIVANTTTPIAPVTDGQLQTSGKLNISDVDNALAAFAVQTNATNANGYGTFTLSADGTWTYTADAAKVAALADKATVTDSFTAVSADGTASTVVTVTIIGANDAPTVTGAVTGNADSLTLNALANASDVDRGTTLSVTNVQTLPAGVTFNAATNSFTLDPSSYSELPEGESATVSVGYAVSDGKTTTPASASWTIIGTKLVTINNPPVATPFDLANGTEDELYQITNSMLLAGVTDVDGDTLTVTSLTLAAGSFGTLTSTGTGTWNYTPAANYNGTVQFNYTVSDGNLSASSTASLALTAVNDAPVAAPVTLTAGTEDTVRPITAADLLAGASDIDGNALTVTALTVASGGGTVTSTGTGTWNYTPAANYNGAVVFNYTVSDGNGGTASSTANLALAAVNDAPVAAPVTLAAGTEDTVRPITAAQLLAGASDIDGNTLTVTALTVASGGGTVTSTGTGTWNYTPAANYNGAVVFNYTVSDGNGGTASSTANLALAAVNDAPVAATSINIASGTEDMPYIISAAILGATDVDGDTLTVSALTVVSGGGTVINNNNGTWTYTPAANYNGAVRFLSTVSDGSLTSTSQVYLTLAAVNDAPIACPVTLSAGTEDTVRAITAADLLAGASDVDGNTLTVTALSVASGGGTVTSTGTGTWNYTPAANYNGAVVFNYTVSDGTLSASSTASLALAAVNDAPVAAPVTLAAGTEDTVRAITAAQLLAGASDVDGNTLTVTALSVASGGGTVTSTGTGTWNYTPAANYNGTVQFNYTVSDGTLSACSTASLALAAVNDAPVAVPVTLAAGTEDTVRAITAAQLLVGASDIDSNTLKIKSLALASGGGTLASTGVGTWDYRPAPNYNGAVQFNYTVTDGSLIASSTASLALTPVNDAPVAVPVNLTAGTEDTVRAITAAQLLVGSSDPENNTRTVTALSVASGGGTVTSTGTGTWNYSPAANYNGAVVFNYTISDGNGGTASSTANLTLAAVNDAPTANSVTLSDGMAGQQYTIYAASLRAGANDIDGDSLNVTLTNPSGVGLLQPVGSGTWVYNSSANYNGIVRFNYIVSDGYYSVTSTASMTLTAASDTLIASTVDLANGTEDLVYTIKSSDLRNGANHAEGSDFWVTNVSVNPEFGTVSNNNDGTWSYRPAANYSGQVEFSYTVSDGNLFATSFASMYVIEINDAPVAGPVTLTGGTEDVPYVIVDATLLAGVNDIDNYREGMRVIAVSVDSGGGQVSKDSYGRWVYTPAADNNGQVVLNYTVDDGSYTSNATAVGKASLKLAPANDAPVATFKTLASGTEDEAYIIYGSNLLIGATDIDGDRLSVQGVYVDPFYGSITANTNPTDGTDGTWTYMPKRDYFGAVSFNYTVTDGKDAGGEVATMTLADTPDASPITLPNGTEDVPYTLTTQALRAGATGIDASTLSVTDLLVTPGAGTLTQNGTSWIYTPTANYVGTVNFYYTLSGGGNSLGGTATLNLNGVNDAPYFNYLPGTFPADAITVQENFSGSFLTVSASDPDAGNTITYSIGASPNGTYDNERFIINSSTGALSFKESPDFESTAPGNDNSYRLQVKATDNAQPSITTTQDLYVNVANVVNEVITFSNITAGQTKFTGSYQGFNFVSTSEAGALDFNVRNSSGNTFIYTDPSSYKVTVTRTDGADFSIKSLAIASGINGIPPGTPYAYFIYISGFDDGVKQSFAQLDTTKPGNTLNSDFRDVVLNFDSIDNLVIEILGVVGVVNNIKGALSFDNLIYIS
jgi:VCBS repeat-containing protein